MKYREINIENGKWSSRHDLEEHIPFCFLPDASDNISVELKGVTLGNLEEKMSIPVKAVRHDFMQQDGHRIDTSSVIPFGSEPFIARKFEYFGHVIKVTSDIRVKAPISANSYSVDELVLKGKLKRFSVIDKKMGPAINWGKIPSEDSVIYESEDLFGVILFESERGTQLEIGTGFDVWRWNISEQLEDLKGKLQIELKDGQIIIRRFIMYSDAEFEIPKRDWRFSWYLSWSSEKKLYEKVPENSNIRDINDFD